MDGDLLRHLETAVIIVMNIGLAAYTYLGDKDKVTTAKQAAMEASFTDRWEEHGERISKLESDVIGHPTHKDIAQLYESIHTLAATVNQLVGETRLQSDLMRMLINREVSK